VADAKRQQFASAAGLDELRRKLDSAIGAAVRANSPAPVASVEAAVDSAPLLRVAPPLLDELEAALW
jgi:hypothetical protein